MEDFKRTELPDGARLLEGEQVRVLVEADVPVKIFCRVGLKFAVGGDAKEHIRWGIVELPDGTRLYISQGAVIVTKQDLNP